MGIIIDIVVFAFILISVLLGYKKGLISLGIHLVAVIIALVIAFILYRPIGNLVINTTSIDESLEQTIQGQIESAAESGLGEDNALVKNVGEGLTQETSRSLAINIIYGVTMLILFIILRICLVFINSIANAIAKLPILKQFNKLGGVLYGLLRGIIIVYAILLIIGLIITLNPEGALNQTISATYLTKVMIEHNIFNLFF